MRDVCNESRSIATSRDVICTFNTSLAHQMDSWGLEPLNPRAPVLSSQIDLDLATTKCSSEITQVPQIVNLIYYARRDFNHYETLVIYSECLSY